MKNLVILISGRGSNMEAIISAAIPELRVAAVIANRPEAAGLAFARARGIATRVVDHRQFASRADFDRALSAEIDGFAPDLLVLAGFMRILTPEFTQHYQGRMLNIHPSLLPSFSGLHTHQRALDAGCTLTGCTVHFVTAELDHGPIVIQGAVPILPDDDEHSLAARVLALEHQIYPRAVRWFAQDRLTLEHNRVRLSGGARRSDLCLTSPIELA
jgi:phosphoribosylglycinamide formyltransferase-1